MTDWKNSDFDTFERYSSNKNQAHTRTRKAHHNQPDRIGKVISYFCLIITFILLVFYFVYSSRIFRLCFFVCVFNLIFGLDKIKNPMRVWREYANNNFFWIMLFSCFIRIFDDFAVFMLFPLFLSSDRIIFWHFGSICSIIFSTSHLDCDFSEATNKITNEIVQMLNENKYCCVFVCVFLLALKAKMDESLLLYALCEAQDFKIRDIQDSAQEAN